MLKNLHSIKICRNYAAKLDILKALAFVLLSEIW